MKLETPIPEGAFWDAVNRFDPSWLNSGSSNVIHHSINEQISLPSGKVQVTFATTEEVASEDGGEAEVLGFLFHCTDSFDVESNFCIIEDYEAPTEIQCD